MSNLPKALKALSSTSYGTMLTHPTDNTKLAKGIDEYHTWGLSLAPHRVSGYNVCASSSIGCRNGCLFYQGLANMPKVKPGRIKKTKLFFEDRSLFTTILAISIARAVKHSRKKGLTPAIRPNVFSDIKWEFLKMENHIDEETRAYLEKNYGYGATMDSETTIITLFPDVQFYDYTKHIYRATRDKHHVPHNYDLTLSVSEDNLGEVLAQKVKHPSLRLAVVTTEKPDNMFGYECIDGDINDHRWTNPPGVVVTLTPKGTAKRDDTGFVIREGNDALRA